MDLCLIQSNFEHWPWTLSVPVMHLSASISTQQKRKGVSNKPRNLASQTEAPAFPQSGPMRKPNWELGVAVGLTRPYGHLNGVALGGLWSRTGSPLPPIICTLCSMILNFIFHTSSRLCELSYLFVLPI